MFAGHGISMPLIQVVATALDQTSGGATTLTISKPTGVIDTDLLIAFMGGAVTGLTWTNPVGWTTATADSANSLHVAYKEVSATDGASYIFNISSGGFQRAGVIVAMRKADFERASIVNTSGGGATITQTNSVSATRSRSMWLGFYMTDLASISWTTPVSASAVAADSGVAGPSFALFNKLVNPEIIGQITATASAAVSTFAGVALIVKPS